MNSQRDIKKFILLSTQRSGSTALRLLINNHPEIRCHDEVKEILIANGYERFLAD